MINYIIQVMLFQVLFLVVYDFVLSKETFFTKNRWYLLMSAIMSFCIPFIQIPSFQKVVSNGVRILLPEIVLSPQNMIEKTEIYQNFNGGLIIFWLGFLFFLVLFSFKVYKLTSLIIKNFIEKKDSYTLIMLPNSKKAFSFFNYIFLGADINELEKEKIISHELIHCKQKHSLDLLFFESLKILMWFNPLLYIYQKRIATVHEYISDAIILKSADKKLYMNTLVNQLFDVENISFVNQFYKHSQLKKRIMMITKEKSNKMKQIKYLLLVPILASMLFYTACSNTENKINEKEVIPFTMIDKAPTFPGCPENDKSCFNKKMQQHFQKEFDVNLTDSLKLSPGKKRIIMLFKINKEGAIVGIKTKAPHPALQEEAVRIIKLLPIMKPGELNGKKVTVKYALPMRIEVEA
jgi:bla regulator protein BlaR1